MNSQLETAGDMKGAVIATNQDNELCHKTMEIFATVSHSVISFDLIFLLR